MPVYRDFAEVGYDKRTIVSLGTFDGVHLGHREIITQLLGRAMERNCRSLIITFDPHPRSVLGNGNNTLLLTPINEKTGLFSLSGVENILVVKFTKEFSQIPYHEFLLNYISSKIGLDSIIVGHDHKFGKGREGDFLKIQELGKQNGFDAIFVPPLMTDGNIISSSTIRDLLKAGDVATANKLLGRDYGFEGEVIEGFRRGRTIGFPTANVGKIDREKFIPSSGVYAVTVQIKEEMNFGVMNIGVRPTFGDGSAVLPEVHIFDFNGEIYGERINVSMVHRIREEKKFASAAELADQISRDAKASRDFFNI